MTRTICPTAPFVGPRRRLGLVLAITVGACVSGCASSGLLSESGPTTNQVLHKASDTAAPGFQLIELNDAVARRVIADDQKRLFSDIFSDAQPSGSTVGPGDALEISIWEAPPAVLFSPANLQAGAGGAAAGVSASNVTTLPEQMIGSNGTIEVPFAGLVPAAGRTTQQIADDIGHRLRGKAHQPQVMVRLAHNSTSNVTVVGEVGSSLRMPLTAKGERLLDAIAAAGGVRQPLGKMTIQLTRGSTVHAMPLAMIVADPRQNVFLQPGDVVSALFQPYSFTVLGATGRSDEISFEGSGLTLAQALGRIGGLQDQRANPHGVFIFRLERPTERSRQTGGVERTTPDGRVAVIYRVDLRDPNTFFVAQSFPIEDRDIIYVSNAPLAEFQKFVNILLTVAAPVSTVAAARTAVN